MVSIHDDRKWFSVKLQRLVQTWFTPCVVGINLTSICSANGKRKKSRWRQPLHRLPTKIHSIFQMTTITELKIVNGFYLTLLIIRRIIYCIYRQSNSLVNINSIIQHSLPAQSIHPALFSYHWSIYKLRHFHRMPVPKRFLLKLSGRQTPIFSLTRHIKKSNDVVVKFIKLTPFIL